MQAVNVRPLSSVGALVRFAEEPQMFAVEFNDGCPIHVSSDGVNFLTYLYRKRVKRTLLTYDNCRCMLALRVMACLQQFWMFCKLKYVNSIFVDQLHLELF